MNPTLRAQPIMAEEVWRQGCEAAGYLASEVGKRGGVRAGAQLTFFFKSEISADGDGHIRMVCPSSANPLWIGPHRHSQRCVS